MGTPDFAVPPLKSLVEAGYDIPLVVTQPDRARGRGKKVTFSPVKQAAIHLGKGMQMSQPEKIKDNEEFCDMLTKLAPDLIVVCAYGMILPKNILDIPRLGCINIHASLLPRYRGAAPIERAVAAGDAITGVTIMHMAEGLDTGDMISKAELETGDKDAGTVTDELSILGATLLIDTIPHIADGTAVSEPQDDRFSTYASMLSKDDAHIDFHQPADKVLAQIRGMNPRPGSYAMLDEKKLRIIKAVTFSDDPEPVNAAPGTILSADKDGIKVSAEDHAITITAIQLPGKNPVHVADYLRGNQIEIGIILK
jgi:methionyl-tRNA formyltransferase